VLDLAREAGLGVLVNRPLNAFTGQRLLRLADQMDGQPMPAAAQIRAALEQRVPEIARCQTLSQQALLALSSLPGVSCVLVGMRTPAYVDDVTALMQQPALPDAWRLFSDDAPA
jgi:aryl-alcohol dehydrogenase-like predicted oxidoreductase